MTPWTAHGGRLDQASRRFGDTGDPARSLTVYLRAGALVRQSGGVAAWVR